MKLSKIRTSTIIRSSLTALTALAVGMTASAAVAAGSKSAPAVRISGKEISIIPELTRSLGNFEKEGVKVRLIDDTEYPGPDYRMQRALNKGQIDMSVHWFQHVLYGNAHNEPTVGLMLFNGAPGLTVMVANRVKDRVRTAADFGGLKIAEGMGYSTKSVIMNLLTARAGLPPHSYTPILSAPEGRLEGTLKALNTGEVDVIAFREPATSAILATGQVTPIYDLTSPASTAKVLGAAYPAQSLFTSPAFVRKHPAQVQKVVNAFVRTMRFVNTHSADEIAAALPSEHYKGKDRRAEIELLKSSMATFAKGSYAFTPADAQLMKQAVDNAQYDDTEEGAYRTVARHKPFVISELYDNRFVDKAMRTIH